MIFILYRKDNIYSVQKHLESIDQDIINSYHCYEDGSWEVSTEDVFRCRWIEVYAVDKTVAFFNDKMSYPNFAQGSKLTDSKPIEEAVRNYKTQLRNEKINQILL